MIYCLISHLKLWWWRFLQLKDLMASVSEKLCQEAANSGKPFVWVQQQIKAEFIKIRSHEFYQNVFILTITPLLSDSYHCSLWEIATNQLQFSNNNNHFFMCGINHWSAVMLSFFQNSCYCLRYLHRSLPRITESVRTQALSASQISREEKSVRLNNAPSSPIIIDEGNGGAGQKIICIIQTKLAYYIVETVWLSNLYYEDIHSNFVKKFTTTII